MKLSDIETLPVTQTTSPAKKRMRLQAPRFIASVIEDARVLQSVASIKDLRPEHLQPLAGGVDAATYLVNLPKEQVIIKLGIGGVAAETEAIEAWKARNVRVPKVLKKGIVPVTKGSAQPLHYLVQQALLDDSGRLIETCAAYLVYAPEKARQVGKALGIELNKMHSAISDGYFGEFKDSHGSRSSYKTWNGYVTDALRQQETYLYKLGVSEADFDAALETIRHHTFVKRGRYLHGDFSIRNVAVKSRDPLKVSIFDPNPLIGDPSWDVSFLINNYEFEKRRLAHDDSQRDLYVRNQQLWTGFKQGYTRRMPDISLKSAQLVQAIYQAQYTESIGDAIGFRVRKEFILELIEALAKGT
jgi:fructosamine-3-kinase